MAKRPCPEKEAYWRAVLQRQLESGLSITDFCRAESISVSSFYQWRRVIRRRDRKKTGVTALKIVPVTITPEPKPVASTDRYEMTIRFPGGIEVVIAQTAPAVSRQ